MAHDLKTDAPIQTRCLDSVLPPSTFYSLTPKKHHPSMLYSSVLCCRKVCPRPSSTAQSMSRAVPQHPTSGGLHTPTPSHLKRPSSQLNIPMPSALLGRAGEPNHLHMRQQPIAPDGGRDAGHGAGGEQASPKKQVNRVASRGFRSRKFPRHFSGVVHRLMLLMFQELLHCRRPPLGMLWAIQRKMRRWFVQKAKVLRHRTREKSPTYRR